MSTIRTYLERTGDLVEELTLVTPLIALILQERPLKIATEVLGRILDLALTNELLRNATTEAVLEFGFIFTEMRISYLLGCSILYTQN